LLLYYFVRGTLSPSFTPCKGDNIPLDPGMPPSAVFYYLFKSKCCCPVRPLGICSVHHQKINAKNIPFCMKNFPKTLDFSEKAWYNIT
ncbi:MAG: hypothetical protein J5926_03115, partial [Ruminococcus sp.]|nr:hypothetical protein [Ruminococcus sp.]